MKKKKNTVTLRGMVMPPLQHHTDTWKIAKSAVIVLLLVLAVPCRALPGCCPNHDIQQVIGA